MGDREGDENKEHGIIYNEQYMVAAWKIGRTVSIINTNRPTVSTSN